MHDIKTQNRHKKYNRDFREWALSTLRDFETLGLWDFDLGEAKKGRDIRDEPWLTCLPKIFYFLIARKPRILWISYLSIQKGIFTASRLACL